MILFYAKITKLHGLRGEVVVLNNNIASLPNLQTGLEVFIAKDTSKCNEEKKPFKILSVKQTPKKIIIGFENIDTIEKATELLGSSVYVDSSLMPKIEEENTYYEGELNSLNVIYNDSVVGKVLSCTILPANAVIEIELNSKKKILLPFISDVFGNIDKNKKTIEINSLDFLKED